MTTFLGIHPGASWATHDVYTGLAAGLRAHGHDVIDYALDGRLATSTAWLQFLWRRHKRKGGPLADTRPTVADAQYHAGKDIVERALRFEVDWVLVVCAAYLHPDCLILARRAGLRLAAVFTESPYDDAQQAKVAPLFDVCFTNERTSLPVLRRANAETHYLPAAYDPASHGDRAYAPSSQNGDVPAHDVVFVGTGFDSRVALLSAVDWTGIDLGLYGMWAGLPAKSPLRPHIREGLVDNARAGALYRRARVGLNLYRSPGEGVAAESLNPRAYELAADGVYTISQPRAEVFERFGALVPTAVGAPDLQALVRHALRNSLSRRLDGGALPALVAEDTYHHRAAQVVRTLEQQEHSDRTPVGSAPPDRGACRVA